MRRTRLAQVAAVAAAVSLAAVGCGGRSDNNSGGSSGGGGGGGGNSSEDKSANVKTGPGFDGNVIKLGVLTPETTIASAVGIPLTRGNRTYWESVNAGGGILGKYKVELVVKDNKYNPSEAVREYEAMKNQVAMFQQVLGTPVVEALEARFEADGLLAGPASLDAFWVHKANLMPLGAPYQIQVINGVDYAMRTMDAKNKKICALTVDDAYGATALKGLDFAQEKFGFSTASRATFKSGDQDFTAQINQLNQAGCQVMVFAALATTTGTIMTAAGQSGFNPKWIGVSPTWSTSFTGNPDLMNYMEANYFVMSEGHNWGDTSVPGMAKMIADKDKFAADQKPDGYFTFGYMQAMATHQILEAAFKNGDVSPTGILNASHNIPELKLQGLYGDYKYGKPEDRNPPRNTTAFAVKRDVPVGLTAKEVNFTTSAAGEYKFED